jgi:type III restriction enzyme
LRQLIQAEPVIAGKITKTLDRVVIKQDEGVGRASGSISRELMSLKQASGVDLLSELSRRLPLSRSTLYKIIRESGTEASIVQNPNAYMDRLFRACNQALGHTLKDKDGIRYYPVGESWDAEMFLRQSIPQSFEDNLVPTTKSIFDAIPCDSNVEREFAGKLEADPDVKLFLKLPSWFKVPTPLGNYNPDWAVVKQEGLDLYLYLIRETKGTDNPDELFRDAEKWKVSFGNKHFSAIDVDYEVVKNWR